MKHLKTYENFEPLNEELGRTSRIILNLPTLLISKLIQNLTDSYPLLNLRWRELKASTKDSKYDPIVGSGGREVFKHDLREITKKDLPSRKLMNIYPVRMI